MIIAQFSSAPNRLYDSSASSFAHLSPRAADSLEKLEIKSHYFT